MRAGHPRAPLPPSLEGTATLPELRLAPALTICHWALLSLNRNSSARRATCGSGCRFPCSAQCFPYRDSMALGKNSSDSG